jgi:hypothetical protein
LRTVNEQKFKNCSGSYFGFSDRLLCSESEEASKEVAPTANNAQTQPPAAIQSFKNPVVPAKQAPLVASTTPNLIQSTNATERVIVVSKGRTDPFGQIFSPYYTSTSNTNTPTFGRSVPVLPPLPAARVLGMQEMRQEYFPHAAQ